MKKLFLFLLIGVFLISSVSAVKFCIDNSPPSAPQNLSVSSNTNNIVLTWKSSTDEPSCSGIEEYVVSRDGEEIGRTINSLLTFKDDNVTYGEHSYSVFAIDKVGHNSGLATKNDVSLSPHGNGVVVSGGSSSTSYICHSNWICQNWSKCIGNEQRRLCNDNNKCGTTSNIETFKKCGNNESINNSIQYVPKPENLENNFNGFLSRLTGAVTGRLSSTTGKIVWSFIILIFLLMIFVVIVKKFRK